MFTKLGSFTAARPLCSLLALTVAAHLVVALSASPTFAASPPPSPSGPSSPDVPEATCPPDGQCFADVPSGNSFYSFINRIYQQDLVTGYPCGGPGEPCDAQNRPYYRPGGLVTRQQMSKFIDQARSLPPLHLSGDSTNPLIFAINTNSNATSIRGDTNSGFGVLGTSSYGDGVVGTSTYGIGVYGATADATGNWAGYFQGNVNVTGSCCQAGAGSYRIDHPTDPANKYLYHSAVTSPDMMDIYNGNVTLDAKGEAWVRMPEWFSALNRDFRYQLTSIGGFSPVYVAEKVRDNRFKIAGGSPGIEVSWQVTGIRHDPYANAHRIPVEQNKPADEQGKYLHPTEWGRPASLGIGYDEQQRMQESIKP